MKKRAYAIFKNGRVHIQAYAGCKDGGGIAYGPVFSCALSDEAQIVHNLQKAFQYSIQGIPTPSREGWKEVQRPMLAAVGAKTWMDLAKGAKSLGLQLYDDIIKIYPTSNYWNRGGESMPDQNMVAPIDAPELGKLIIRGFEVGS